MAKELREPAILLALYLIPSVALGSGSAASAALVLDSSVIIATALRNAVFALLVLYLMDISGGFDMSRRRQHRGATMVIGIVLTALMLFVVAGTVRGVVTYVAPGEALTRKSVFSPALSTETSPVSLILVAAALVLSGAVEELFFRSYLLTRLARAGFSRKTALVTGAFFFSLGHLWQGPEAVILAACAAIILGVVWFRTGTLTIIALGHGLYNVTALLITLL